MQEGWSGFKLQRIFFKAKQNGAIFTSTQTLWCFMYSALKCLPLSKQAFRSMPAVSGLVLLCFPGNMMKAMEKEINSLIPLFCVFYRTSSVPKAEVPKVRQMDRHL